MTLLSIGCGGGGSDSTPNSAWSITPAGGTFQSSNKVVTVIVPAGAVAATTNVTASPITTAPTPPVGHVYVANTAHTFTHVNFTTPATLKFTFPAGSVPEASVSKLKIFKQADGTNVWTQLDTTVDAVNRTVSTPIASFSSYALFYPAGSGWVWTNAGGIFDFETFSVNLPSGALTSTVEVQPRRTPTPFTPPTGWVAIEKATFDLGASNPDVHTISPVTFGITYTAAAVPADARPAIKMFHKENAEAAWVQLTSFSDVAHLQVTAQHTHLGTFALFYPTAVASLFYIEERSVEGSNNRILDMYVPSSSGEQHLFTTTIDNVHRPVNDSYRDDDRSYLEPVLDGTTWTANLYKVDTQVSTPIHDISPEAGWRYESVMVSRSTRRGPGRTVMVSTQEVNTAGTAARDRLLLYRIGSATQVLISIDRDPSSAPAILRGFDTDADGQVLGWYGAEGLVKFTAGGRVVLAGPDFFPQKARFSPTGSKVLFQQSAGTGAGWKLVDSTGGAVTSIEGLTGDNLARWGADDGELLVSFNSPREIRSLHLSTNVFRTVATTAARTGTFVDIGLQAH